MPTVSLDGADRLAKICEGVMREAPPVRNVERGGVDLRKLDEAGTNFELVLTYVYKAGKLAKKERTVIAVLPVKRVANGLFDLGLENVVFRSLSFKKGNFEEEWSGNIEEAQEKFPEVVEAFKLDIDSLLTKITSK